MLLKVTITFFRLLMFFIVNLERKFFLLFNFHRLNFKFSIRNTGFYRCIKIFSLGG
jgi:hypothetical protein